MTNERRSGDRVWRPIALVCCFGRPGGSGRLVTKCGSGSRKTRCLCGRGCGCFWCSWTLVSSWIDSGLAPLVTCARMFSPSSLHHTSIGRQGTLIGYDVVLLSSCAFYLCASQAQKYSLQPLSIISQTSTNQSLTASFPLLPIFPSVS